VAEVYNLRIGAAGGEPCAELEKLRHKVRVSWPVRRVFVAEVYNLRPRKRAAGARPCAELEKLSHKLRASCHSTSQTTEVSICSTTTSTRPSGLRLNPWIARTGTAIRRLVPAARS
jgi:hypothetical protein